MKNSTKDQPAEQPAVIEVVDLQGAELTRAQRWMEDKVVRVVREIGYCSEANRVLKRVFGDPLDGEAWRDSDGIDCYGNRWTDAEGYDRNGYDANGYNREGFNAEGYDRDGFNAEGLDYAGIHRDDPAQFRFDLNGYDKDGYNRRGLNTRGRTREQQAQRDAQKARSVRLSEVHEELKFVFNTSRRDKDGYDKYGYKDGVYDAAHDYHNGTAAEHILREREAAEAAAVPTAA